MFVERMLIDLGNIKYINPLGICEGLKPLGFIWTIGVGLIYTWDFVGHGQDIDDMIMGQWDNDLGYINVGNKAPVE